MLHVVVCEIWGCCGVREERLGGGEMLFESRPWYGKWKIGRLQSTSRVRLVVLYYINFTTGADLTISVR